MSLPASAEKPLIELDLGALAPRPSRTRVLTGCEGRADRGKVCELILRVAGIEEPDRLTSEQVQDVYDELDRLITESDQQAAKKALAGAPPGPTRRPLPGSWQGGRQGTDLQVLMSQSLRTAPICARSHRSTSRAARRLPGRRSDPDRAAAT